MNIGFKDTSMIKMKSDIGNYKRKILRMQVTLDKTTISQSQRTNTLNKQRYYFFFNFLL